MRMLHRFLLSGLAIATAACTEGQPPPGDLQRFRLLEALPAVAAFAGQGAKLIDAEGTYVLSDGSMDLTADYRPNATYRFHIRATADDIAALPPLAPGISVRAGDTLTASVWVRKPDSLFRSGKGRLNRGMTRAVYRGPATDKPAVQCDPAALWKTAIAQGASAKAAAKLQYFADGVQFSIAEPRFELAFNAACEPLPRR